LFRIGSSLLSNISYLLIFNISSQFSFLNLSIKSFVMQVKTLLVICIALLIGMSACKKSEFTPSIPYIEPADLRVGTYKGMFQECGPVVCYDKDTTFQITKENSRYYLVFGTHKDEIEYSYPVAKEFSAVEFYPLDSLGINSGCMFTGYYRNDSAFVIFFNGWGVHNNYLLSGKKQ